MNKKSIALFLISILLISIAVIDCAYRQKKNINIDVWYGAEQAFGKLGNPQKWINILGNVSSPDGIALLSYSINEETPASLTVGTDKHRLASQGDFNIEIDYNDLAEGKNILKITAVDSLDNRAEKAVTVNYTSGKKWSLPYSVNWSGVKNIQDVVQVVDGKWKLESNGARTVVPFYDRVLAVGDITWQNYEVTVETIIHSYKPPTGGYPGGGVTHFGIGARWQGHHDDGHQPRIKWYPLGAATEFKIYPGETKWRWRILLGPGLLDSEPPGREIELGVPYKFKMRVETLPGPETLYRLKTWKSSETEPKEWDHEGREGKDDYQNGCLLFVAHYTDVTVGDFTVVPVTSGK